MVKKIIITGVAGFIGGNLAHKLLDSNVEILGIDNMNPYYDVELKEKRLHRLISKSKSNGNSKFRFENIDIVDKEKLCKILSDFEPEAICHLAAQAGVRYSIENPKSYIDNNILGTLNLLEFCKDYGVSKFIFSSTSSVYGLSDNMPFKETESIETPVSTYAASKKACELLCHVYFDLYNINSIILRFFTVYGPWGRPDMALFKFTNSIINGKAIKVFNEGNMQRDFTYVDDIVSGFILALKADLKYEIINLGCGKTVNLMDFIKEIENNLQMKAQMEFMPMQLGDVHKTHADISKAKRLLGYKPKVNINKGITEFISWYHKYYVDSGSS